MQLDILVFSAHPDDVELSCGGTVLKHIAMGKKVGVVDLTRGEMGTRGTPEKRQQEADAATRLMGLSVRENLGFDDCFFCIDKAHMLEVIRMIRKYRPKVVIANTIDDRHPDHARAAQLVVDSVFYAGLSKMETREQGQLQEAYRPKALYHYIQDRYIKPDFVVDISDFMEKKLEVIQAFSSQFYDPNSAEPSTYISSERFMPGIIARAAEFGKPIDVKFAEGFKVSRIPGVEDITSLA